MVENVEKFIPTLSKILPIHSQIPVLSNLLLETTKEGIFIYTTNLEIGARIKIPGKVEENGSTTVPGKQFLEALSSLPRDKATIELDKENLKLNCRDNTMSFQTISRDEFPNIFEEKGDKIHDFSEREMKDVFTPLIFAASMDEGRPELTGILLDQKEKDINFVATDGFRLSLKRLNNKKILEGESLILPAKLITEAIGLKSSVTMYVHKKANQVIFESEDVILVGRLINGQFPNYERVIPASGKTTIALDVETFVQKLRLVSIFARDAANIVKISIEDRKLKMQARSSGVGEGDVELEGKQEGESNEIAFNIKFLNDLLKSVSAKEIIMQVSSPVEPALFKTADDPEFLHVIMPVRVQE